MADPANMEPSLTDRQNAWKLMFFVVPALITGGFSYLKSREAKSTADASYTTLSEEVVALQKELALVKDHAVGMETLVGELQGDLETIASHPYLAHTSHHAHKPHLSSATVVTVNSTPDAGNSILLAEPVPTGAQLGPVPSEAVEPPSIPKFIHRKLPTSLDEAVEEFQNPKKQQHVLQ